jgi:hypothetical protein
MRETLARTRSEQHHLWTIRKESFEVCSAQGIEAGDIPLDRGLVRGEADRRRVADIVDLYEAGAVGRDGIERGERIWVKLQFDSGIRLRQAARQDAARQQPRSFG